METKQLHRIPSQSVLGGVAAGVANYFGIDKAWMRLIFVALFIFANGIPMFLLYIILWFALPIGDTTQPTFVSDSNRPFSNLSTQKNWEWAGYGLVIVGGLLFMDELFYWISFDKYIPAALFIGLGLYFIFRNENKKEDDYIQPKM